MWADTQGQSIVRKTTSDGVEEMPKAKCQKKKKKGLMGFFRFALFSSPFCCSFHFPFSTFFFFFLSIFFTKCENGNGK